MNLTPRFQTAIDAFKCHFSKLPTRYFFSNGRLEILGNHTDHEGGHCLVAGCSLGICGAVSPLAEPRVEIVSEGYRPIRVSLFSLVKRENEKKTSIALTRGVLNALKSRGYQIGGFEATINSDIFPGAGVSSSAAYELFVAEVENALYNDDKISRLVLAQCGQESENVYFGKPSGLLDQIGSSFGGISFVDFANPTKAEVLSLSPFDWPLHLYLVNAGGSHAKLSHLYAEIPADMQHVASTFGKRVLSEVPATDFYNNAYSNDALTARQRERAFHYYGEDARVVRALSALQKGEESTFLECERASELSQMTLLHNVMVPSHFEGSPLQTVLRTEEVLPIGAARVMGGGFLGSVLCFVPTEEEASFRTHMISYYGEAGVKLVSIPPCGAHEVKLN